MNKNNSNKYLNLTLLFILVAFVSATISIGNYSKGLGNGDAAGYYVYLPSLFIHNDFGFIEEIMGDGSNDYSGKYEGPVVNKYTCGVAILQSPFFAVGHFVAGITGAKQDGYSQPYLTATVVSILFYVMIGLFFLSRVLKKLFDEKTAIVIILVIALATNLFYFTTSNNRMAHGYSFFLIATLMYFTVKWYEEPLWRYAFFVGLSAGFIALIRPVDILILTIPVFYGITNVKEIGDRFNHIKLHWKKYLFAILVFGMCALPQFLYWKEVTGHWYYYSYRTEGFHFNDSHVIDGLIDGKNGWLRYTPVMIFSLLGMLFLLKNKKWLWPIVLFFPLYVFVIFSWHNWFYINSFGSRPLVGAYALLAIPMAYLVSYSFNRKGLKWVLSGLFIFLAALNIFQTYQESWGVSRSESASNAYYLKIFGKTKMDYEMLSTYESNISQPYHTICQGSIYENTITDSSLVNLEKKTFNSPPYSIRLDDSNPNFYLLEKQVKDIGVKAGQYLKISGHFYTNERYSSWWSQALIVVHLEKDGNPRPWNQMWINNKIQAEKSDFSLWSNHAKEWGEVHFYYKVPHDISPDEYIKVFVKNNSKNWLLVDDLTIEICDKK